jgi:hypothetical protein
MKVSDRGCAVVAAKFLALTPLLSLVSITVLLAKGMPPTIFPLMHQSDVDSVSKVRTPVIFRQIIVR